MNSSSSSLSSKVNKTYSKDPTDLVTINEKIILTKNQHEVLNIICKTYQISTSEYMQEALVGAMKFDIQEGNFCDTLSEKIDSEDKGKNNSPSSPASLAPNPINSHDIYRSSISVVPN